MQLSRREFAKLSSGTAILALLPTALVQAFLTGCGVDAVIAALGVAGSVARAAAGILGAISPKLASVLTTVATDLAKVVDLYKQYDSAAGDKPSIFQLIQAPVSTITNNLAEILGAIHVFNPALQVVIKTAVAIVNTAISLIISHLPAQHKSAMQAKRLELPPLPIIDGAKNANDLKAKWNQTVQAEYPSAVVQ